MTRSRFGRRNASARRWSAVGILGTATAMLSLGQMSPALSVPTTSGGWEFFSPQSYTDSISAPVPGVPVYTTAVRPPINADGTSNFPAKRGAIPVQFDLLGSADHNHHHHAHL